jgi:integrase
MPILGLFTGARQNELAQLYLDDIKQVDGGVWVIDINDDGPDKKIKNHSSKRRVPLHPFLVDTLRLPTGYVEQMRSKGKKRLFPELPGGRDGYSKNISRWFNRKYKVACGVVQKEGEGKKDFHSIRGTFATHLARKQVPDKMLKQVLGHADDGSTTFSVYVEDFPPEQLLEEVIKRVDYGLDLSHLKRCKRFVIQR